MQDQVGAHFRYKVAVHRFRTGIDNVIETLGIGRLVVVVIDSAAVSLDKGHHVAGHGDKGHGHNAAAEQVALYRTVCCYTL